MLAKNTLQLGLFPALTATDRSSEIVNVASVPQLSPFRYPGGKTWFVPTFRKWVKSRKDRPKLLIEPFAGGGIVGLTAVSENLVDRVILADIDKQIAAVWETILNGNAEWLAQRIINFNLTKENLLTELAEERSSTKEIAFQTILKNRTFHGGILANGSSLMKFGENGKGLLSRWYPTTLARRILSIDFMAHKIKFICQDGLDVIRRNFNDKDIFFFIDPPYTAGGKKAGKRLYNHFEINHDKLFALCKKAKADFIMTYDNAVEVQALAEKYGFEYKPIAMKNTHHSKITELVISKNLSWLK